MDQSKKKFLKNMVGFSMMTWISFLLGFISSPIATRLFVPEELAKFNMFSTYGSLIASVCYLGLDQAYVRFFREPPGKSTRKSLYTFCTLVPLAFSLVAALVLSFFWRSLSVQVMGTESRSVFVQLCLFSFFLVLFRFLSLSYRMEQNAKLYTIQGVCHVVVTKLAYLAVGFGDARGANRHSGADGADGAVLSRCVCGCSAAVSTCISPGRSTAPLCRRSAISPCRWHRWPC